MWNPYEPLTTKTRWILGLTTAFLVVSVWGILSGGGFVSSNKLPAPWEILEGFLVLASYNEARGTRILLDATVASSSRVLISAILVVLTAVPLGILMGASPRINAMLGRLLDPFRSAPIVAILPILVIWFGLGEMLKVVFLWLGAFVYLVPMTRDAMLGVGRDMYISLKDLGATDLEAIRHGTLPMAMPRIWDGIRVSVSVMWTYITVAEYVNAKAGLGQMINHSMRFSAFNQVFAGIIVILTLALITDLILALIGSKLFPWASE